MWTMLCSSLFDLSLDFLQLMTEPFKVFVLKEACFSQVVEESL